MRHILYVMSQRACLALYFQQTVLKAFIREILRVQRIHNTHPVDNKAIGIHVRSYRTECNCPYSIGITSHWLAPCELNIHLYVLCIVIPILECHRPIIISDD